MILDTCFIIDLLKNKNGAYQKSKELENSSTSLLTTAVTIFEIWQGIHDIQNPERIKKTNQLLSSLGLLQLDIDSAKIAGEIHSRLINKGIMIESEDSMIAGICVTKNETLLTRNVKHFSRIDGLKIETY
ncbi:PIN domain-containing protein [Candidatus Woesearchaeota archaeon]|nr:PIN domain-containing protein [Candidatus Woesearchaeota archaeon]